MTEKDIHDNTTELLDMERKLREKTWFQKAFPDPQKRYEAIKAWKEDFYSYKLGEKSPRVFTLTCKDMADMEMYADKRKKQL